MTRSKSFQSNALRRCMASALVEKARHTRDTHVGSILTVRQQPNSGLEQGKQSTRPVTGKQSSLALTFGLSDGAIL